MKYFGLEVHFRRHDGVLRCETNFDKKDMILIRSIFGSLYESFPIEEVILIIHEQELVEPSLGCLYGLFHQPLFIHLVCYDRK